MRPLSPPAPPIWPAPRWAIVAAEGIIVLATLAAFSNSFGGPFVFDDIPTIVENGTIRNLRDSFFPPVTSGLTVNGRPVVNFSLALNYVFGGIDPRGYHAVNLAIHIGAALALFGLVRRTLQRTRFGPEAVPLALATAVLWAMHPLQTEAVTYVVQRSESLMGLFYLLTLYAFVRSADAPKPCRWKVLSIAVCALGMATKEVMVSAPLLVLLHDRAFVAGSFRDAWRMRRRYYVALFATWLVLLELMIDTGGRGGTAGFGLGVTGWSYALKQCEAVVHYLRLAFWPAPLIFDYGGMVLVKDFAAVWPQALLLAALVTATLWACWRRPALGFLGVWFFAILAPTSSVVPLADTMFEHRMYLPLAAVVVLVALGVHAALGRRSAFVFAALSIGLGYLTVQRNTDYGSELALWQDTVEKRPENVRAHYTLGSVLAQTGDTAGAIAQYETALRLKPDSAQAHNNLGNTLVRLGRVPEALPHYEAALRITPGSADAHNNLANALVRLQRVREARAHYEAALQLRPAFADAHNNLGNVLARLGEFAAAARHYEAALRLRPDLADAEANLGNVLAQSGRVAEALPHYEAALRLRPDFVDAHFNFATALTEVRQFSAAVVHYEAVLRLQPGNAAAREALDLARLNQEMSGAKK